jgi:hypothetical protein
VINLDLNLDGKKLFFDLEVVDGEGSYYANKNHYIKLFLDNLTISFEIPTLEYTRLLSSILQTSIHKDTYDTKNNPLILNYVFTHNFFTDEEIEKIKYRLIVNSL